VTDGRRDWTLDDVENAFLGFMQDNGHVLVEGHSVLSPTDDVLFTTAGMHPLTPYLSGRPHPAGRRLCDVQRCLRTTDIEEVGDDTHLTTFEMVGSWSLGDYFEETAIPLSMRLLTEVFGIDPHALYVTTFAGDVAQGLGPDTEAPGIWAQCFADLGVDPAGRVTALGVDDNWWSGPLGLCGPDTEIFVYVGQDPRPVFSDCPEFVEVWNNVFMTYERGPDGALLPLAQRNVDTGLGAERTEAFLNGHATVWDTPELMALTDGVADGLGVALGDAPSTDPETRRSLRIVADHLRAALVVAAAGVTPAPSRHGYVLRRLVRRAVRHADLLRGNDSGLAEAFTTAAAEVAAAQGLRWADLAGASGEQALAVVEQETGRFVRTLRRAVDDLHEHAARGTVFDGDFAFRAADTLGYPAELAAEEAARVGMLVDPGWPQRYEQLREQQRARSRGPRRT
jgi:alanyl-tRNA synthetase